MGGSVDKQFLEIGGCPIIVETLLVFQSAPQISEIILVTPENEIVHSEALVKEYDITKVKQVVTGGRERQDSIRNGLLAVDPETEVIVVHDGVRPFVTPGIISETIDAAKSKGAAIAAVPVKDTVKSVDESVIDKTVPRNKLWLAQTPQAFSASLIKRAYEVAYKKGFIGTDDASLVEALGEKVRIVMGAYKNIKITTPEDLLFAEAILKERTK